MSSRHDFGGRLDLVIPVKTRHQAKSRLVTPPGVDHSALAVAMALDTVDAARSCELVASVLVVTSDDVIAEELRDDDRVSLLADPGTGLRAALAAGLAGLEASARVGVLLGDLPALRPRDLDTALRAAAEWEGCFVPDASGNGTVLLAGHHLAPRFGPDSARLHAQLGYVRLDLDLPRLRSDVDDETSLRAAVALGLGRRSAAVLARSLR